MKYKNPQEFYDRWNGKAVDVDGAYGAQCWDGFAKYDIDQGIPCSTYCKLTGYAGDLYKLRYDYGYDKYYEFFYPKNAKRGDWIFWDRHVAMVWDVDLAHDRVQCFGQNQGGKKYFTLKWYTLSTALGCMRYKGWIDMNGWQKENGKWYFYVNGKKTTGWKKINWKNADRWFFFDKDGVMVTGWREITYKGAKKWFWFDENGVMATGFKEIKWKGKDCFFLFDSDGVMQTGTHKMELTFDSSGALTGGKAV